MESSTPSGQKVAPLDSTHKSDAHPRAGTLWLDVEEACKLQLQWAGLREEGVTVTGVCTSCRRDLFYSARGDGEPTGRFALVGMLE